MFLFLLIHFFTFLFLFKEAYEEFKHVLLALIFDKDDQTSPVANEVGYNLCMYSFSMPHVGLYVVVFVDN